MGNFSAEWLSLRERADHAARSRRLTDAVAHAVRTDGALTVVDLGAGTGSNLRFLAPRLPNPQRWVLVDRDSDLLARAGSFQIDVPLSMETRRLDLSRIDEQSFASLFDAGALVTASALLDLVSERWIASLVRLTRRARATALFALTYDGRIECTPADPYDETIRRLINEHQRRDKGFGPALGPEATSIAARAFALQGYRVARDRSDWLLDGDSRQLQEQLVDGWARAAVEIARPQASAIDAWRTRRLAQVGAGDSRIVVGHEDLAALID